MCLCSKAAVAKVLSQMSHLGVFEEFMSMPSGAGEPFLQICM